MKDLSMYFRLLALYLKTQNEYSIIRLTVIIILSSSSAHALYRAVQGKARVCQGIQTSQEMDNCLPYRKIMANKYIGFRTGLPPHFLLLANSLVLFILACHMTPSENSSCCCSSIAACRITQGKNTCFLFDLVQQLDNAALLSSSGN